MKKLFLVSLLLINSFLFINAQSTGNNSTSVSCLELNAAGNANIAGSIGLTGSFNSKANYFTLSKSGGWIPWASRNTTTTEASIDFTNINNANFGGTVGIGFTGAPSNGSKLGVNGSINVGITKPALYGFGAKLYFLGTDDEGADPMWMSRYTEIKDHTELRVNIGDNASGDDKFIIGNTNSADTTHLWNPHFSVLNNGRVGIGTAEPKANLDVVSWAPKASTNSIVASFQKTGGSFGGSSIVRFGNTGQSTADIEVNSGYANDLQRVGSSNCDMNIVNNSTNPSYGSINFYTNNSAKMSIKPNGFVGIGTTSPDAMLTVKGSIHAREVTIDYNNALADFVFAPTYKLMPLHEVETFVKTNSHLPEVPSAKEVSKNGMNMGDMQNKLLQKVEELTLYLIEQQKIINQQGAEIRQLKNRIEQ